MTKNECVFSPDRRYRYTLRHRWAHLFPERRVMWIGLNPSTADEEQLDPTLRRIRDFTTQWGFNCFIMTNLFAFRATDPRVMMAEADPVGPDNDAWLLTTAQQCDLIVAAWGAHGSHMDRANHVIRLFQRQSIDCLGLTKAGDPKHPLYLPRTAARARYKIAA